MRGQVLLAEIADVCYDCVMLYKLDALLIWICHFRNQLCLHLSTA